MNLLYQLKFLLVVIASKNLLNGFFEQQKYCNQIINKHFNKKLKMTIEDEDNYQNSQNCWICNEKIDDKKVRDHCHITGKYRCCTQSM